MSQNRRTPSADLYGCVLEAITEIEAETKRISHWSTEPLPPQACEFREAFARDTMAFAQWLQFVLVPRV